MIAYTHVRLNCSKVFQPQYIQFTEVEWIHQNLRWINIQGFHEHPHPFLEIMSQVKKNPEIQSMNK